MGGWIAPVQHSAGIAVFASRTHEAGDGEEPLLRRVLGEVGDDGDGHGRALLRGCVWDTAAV
jgi:hypothetical protein